MLNKVITGLEIMGMGMGGIFVVIILIMLGVMLLNKVTTIKKEEK